MLSVRVCGHALAPGDVCGCVHACVCMCVRGLCDILLVNIMSRKSSDWLNVDFPLTTVDIVVIVTLVVVIGVVIIDVVAIWTVNAMIFYFRHHNVRFAQFEVLWGTSEQPGFQLTTWRRGYHR